MIFGSKEVFAIEIAPTKKEKQFRLCLWISNERYGNFQKAAVLDYSVKGLNKFLETKEELYENKFDDMSVKEIFDYILASDRFLTKSAIQDSDIERMEKYRSFLGDQLDNQYAGILFLYRDSKVIFLTFRGFLKPMRFDKYIVDYHFFATVVNEYIGYVNQEVLI